MNIDGLNSNQQAAVTAPLGPVLVLAGAGSGKTRVLTCRIAYVIEQGWFNPGEILALTFTNKAAKEMGNRVMDLLSGSQIKLKKHSGVPLLGTFHSVCARLLRKEIYQLGYTPGFVIFDTDDQLKVIREVMNDLGFTQQRNGWSPQLFRSFIGTAKNQLQTPSEFKLGLEPHMEEAAGQVYAAYQNFLFKQNAVDFDDLLLLVIKLFTHNPQTLEKYQNMFRYILVDEYQDTNPAQFRLLELLAVHHNLFVVGDDAQSIYAFRGSDIRNILSFEKQFPEAQVIKLEQNYRSTKNILAIAQSVIELSPEQKPKKLWTENESGEKIKLEEVEDERAEALFVTERIIRQVSGIEEEPEVIEEVVEAPQTFSILDHFLAKQRTQWNRAVRVREQVMRLPKYAKGLNEIAILYRTHAQSRALEEAFMHAGIPYHIVGGLRFYERKEIKDVLAYLRLIQNFRDYISLKRVINEPARGVGEKSLDILKQFLFERAGSVNETNGKEEVDLAAFIGELEGVKLSGKAKTAVMAFFNEILLFTEFNEEDNLLNLMRLVVKRVGFEKMLKDGTEVGEQRYENVKELLNVARAYENQPWQEGLSHFLEQVSLTTDIDSVDGGSEKVTLMTLHSAKGLEFDCVFFVGLEEGILPHSRAIMDPTQLAEEIRLAYVGMTRARKRLCLVYARMRSVFGNVQMSSPSRVLRVLPEDKIQYRGSLLATQDTGDLTYESIDF